MNYLNIWAEIVFFQEKENILHGSAYNSNFGNKFVKFKKS